MRGNSFSSLIQLFDYLPTIYIFLHRDENFRVKSVCTRVQGVMFFMADFSLPTRQTFFYLAVF